MVPKKVSLQLSFKESISDVQIVQLDRWRVPQTRSSGCKRSISIVTVCLWYSASLDVSRLQRSQSAVGHETAVICHIGRHLPRQRLASQAFHFELDTLSDGQPVEFEDPTLIRSRVIMTLGVCRRNAL